MTKETQRELRDDALYNWKEAETWIGRKSCATRFRWKRDGVIDTRQVGGRDYITGREIRRLVEGS